MDRKRKEACDSKVYLAKQTNWLQGSNKEKKLARVINSSVSG
jgi:hypothetical protein